jgi:hypothetical protein
MASQSQMSNMATGDNAEGTVLEDYITGLMLTIRITKWTVRHSR